MKEYQIDCRFIKTKIDCCRYFENVFNLPPVSDKWQSLYDWMTDLSWIDDIDLHITIKNLDLALINETQEKQNFIELLDDIKAYWKIIDKTRPDFKRVDIKTDFPSV